MCSLLGVCHCPVDIEMKNRLRRISHIPKSTSGNNLLNLEYFKNNMVRNIVQDITQKYENKFIIFKCSLIIHKYIIWIPGYIISIYIIINIKDNVYV